MTRRRRQGEAGRKLGCGLLLALLLAAPALSFRTSYHCLITGRMDLTESCESPEPANCCDRDRSERRPEQGLSDRLRPDSDPDGCCELIVTRVIPRVPILESEDRQHGPSPEATADSPTRPPNTAVCRAAAPLPGIAWPRAGPHRYLLFSSLLI